VRDGRSLLMVFLQQYDERSRDIFGENYEQLSQIKAKYDPKNMFDKLFAITPATKA
jgi:FAD/FMN-containing dehydrogenase